MIFLKLGLQSQLKDLFLVFDAWDWARGLEQAREISPSYNPSFCKVK